MRSVRAEILYRCKDPRWGWDLEAASRVNSAKEAERLAMSSMRDDYLGSPDWSFRLVEESQRYWVWALIYFLVGMQD